MATKWVAGEEAWDVDATQTREKDTSWIDKPGVWQEIDSWMGHKKPDPKYLVQGLAGPRYKPEQGLPAAIAPPDGLGGRTLVEGLGGASYPQGQDPVPLVGARYPPAQGLVGAPPLPPVQGLEGARFPPAQGSVVAPVQGLGGAGLPPAQQPLPRYPPAQGLVAPAVLGLQGARLPPAQGLPAAPVQGLGGARPPPVQEAVRLPAAVNPVYGALPPAAG